MADNADLREIATWEATSPGDSAARLDELQSRLLAYQQTIFKHGHRIVLVFEGADAAGKGGVIARLTRKLDPRGYRVYPIGPPAAEDLSRHYLQRFWRRFPRAGEMAIFDRSWYGRVLIERVDELIPGPAWQRAFGEINELERWLVDDGILMIKFFLHLSPGEQKARLLERMRKPDKRWKVTGADLDAYEKFDAYTGAWNDMLLKTNTAYSPWLVIPADNKHAARVSVLQWLVAMLAEKAPRYGQQLSPELLERARSLFGEESFN